METQSDGHYALDAETGVFGLDAPAIPIPVPEEPQ